LGEADQASGQKKHERGVEEMGQIDGQMKPEGPIAPEFVIQKIRNRDKGPIISGGR
jgi:hypothetical protein